MVEGKGVRLHETAARPAGDYPKWGDGTPRATGKEASQGKRGDGTGERGHREGVGPPSLLLLLVAAVAVDPSPAGQVEGN